MNAFAEDWDAAGQDDDWTPPDGAYKAKLVDGGAFTGRTDSKNYCKLEWQLLEGDLVGRRFEDFKQISNKVGLRITREKLILLGLDPDGIDKTITGLDKAIQGLIGAVATISVARDGTFLNVSVFDVQTGESDIPSDPPPASGVEDDTEVPF